MNKHKYVYYVYMFNIEYYITSVSKTTFNLKQYTIHIAQKKNPEKSLSYYTFNHHEMRTYD